MTRSSYVVALGSNRRGRHGSPEAEVRAALEAIGGIVVASPIVASAPVGPSIRRFVNAVAVVDSDLDPPAMLARLKTIEVAFGRRRGRRWGARVIDLDIILWSSGPWHSRGLTIPHPAFRERSFVLGPLTRLAPELRDPVTIRTVRQLAHRLAAVDRRPRRP